MILAIPDRFKTEVGWFHEISTNADERVYEITENIHVAGQTVGATTVNIEASDFEDMLMRVYDDKGHDAYASVRCWAHSHVDMGVSPSATDEGQLMDFVGGDVNFFIMLIVNKKGGLRIDFYDFENNMVYEELEYDVIGVNGNIDELFKDKVHKQKVQTAWGNNTKSAINEYQKYTPPLFEVGDIVYAYQGNALRRLRVTQVTSTGSYQYYQQTWYTCVHDESGTYAGRYTEEELTAEEDMGLMKEVGKNATE